jgi:hypothetical protein
MTGALGSSRGCRGNSVALTVRGANQNKTGYCENRGETKDCAKAMESISSCTAWETEGGHNRRKP